MHQRVRFAAIAIIALILAAVVFGLWAMWLEYDRGFRRKAFEEAQSKFLAAAETSMDAFVIFECVRDQSEKVIDFRFQYVNANFEQMMGKPRSKLLGQLRSTITSVPRSSELFERLCAVAATGDPMCEEFLIVDPEINATWLRLQVTKLGDGLAMTCCDIGGIKAAQEQYKHLLEFTDSVFQNAPFSIIAADTTGLITAMNVAAEKLTGYSREELVGKAPLTILHDERELLAKIDGDDPLARIERDGFRVLTAGAAAGEMEEQEWTLIRRDGTRTPINLAVRAVRSDAG
ncbi:MAG: PAS domain S-box protein, partial [Edaphobacter sp.]